ncbi:hypothetical protein PanWU01x14_339330 [Parasponia andersonii]|uniref:F-box protein At3g26010-like beta-propeller domain-containing protein n=1 Tax=Parasponia andersonii TaxID=3476 RepID=A0A2P5AET8_PARAD|nr:hypothetical protein PanWU01x14_339330 [Parasponia andersonii]
MVGLDDESSRCKRRRVVMSDSEESNVAPSAPPTSLAIKASVRDLLLVSSSYLEYHICNPLTWQCVPLPEPPRGRYNVCGLLTCEPNNSQLLSNYRVLLKGDISVNEYEYVLYGAICCSGTGKWSRSMLWCPRTLVPEFEWWSHFFVANNGILYSQLTGNEDDIRGFAAVHLSSGTISTDSPIRIQFQFRFLHLPFGFGRGWRACLEHVCSGVVQGRLRLSQLLKTNQKFVLKVWELNHNSNDNFVHWLLVHEVRLKRNLNRTNRMFMAAFHPNNGDVIFVFCDHDLYRYKIGEGKYKKVGQLPHLKYPTNNADKLTRYFRTCTLVHPTWPTLIPILPST